jgi:hypothetical protein
MLMCFLDRFRKKKEDEASRIARLAKTGRMTDGRVIDAESDGDGKILQVTYAYTLAGVQYESSQELSQSQQQRTLEYAPGRQIIVRYDPRQPANSIVT